MIKTFCNRCEREIKRPLERPFHPKFRGDEYISVDLCSECYNEWLKDKGDIENSVAELEQVLHKKISEALTSYFGLEDEYGYATVPEKDSGEHYARELKNIDE